MPSSEVDVAKLFDITGRVTAAVPFGDGHINETYRVAVDGGPRSGYLLQQINTRVFTDPAGVMENIARVTNHVRKKCLETGRDPDRHSLTVIPSRDGARYVVDEHGRAWRMYLFIDRTVGLGVADSETTAREGGRAFGEFQRLLRDLPGARLNETIPAFHNIDHRLEQFRAAVAEDPVARARDTQREIDEYGTRAHAMREILSAAEAGRIPERIAHNDTKLNNVLIDEASGRAVCVIDLDTVMPGYSMYDFGDSIRTVTNTAEEDERDPGKVGFNMGYFTAFSEGFLGETAAFLTPDEIALFPFAAKFFPYIMGLRMLTDFLNGDVYYKTRYPTHNLVRARSQLALLRAMENRYDEMRAEIARISRACYITNSRSSSRT